MPRTYVKGKDSYTWHWCKNCPQYPRGTDVDRMDDYPITGDLCDQCLAKAAEARCNE